VSYTIIYLPKAEKYLIDLDEKNYDRIEDSVLGFEDAKNERKGLQVMHTWW